MNHAQNDNTNQPLDHDMNVKNDVRDVMNDDYGQSTALRPDDERLIDALVEGDFDQLAVANAYPDDRPRVHAVSSLLGLLRDYPVEDCPEELVHATLAKIDRYEDACASRLNIATRMTDIANPAMRRIRLPSFITVAAVILIVAGVFWPILSGLRQRSVDMACANNLRVVGFGLGQYAADHGGAMPTAQAGMAGALNSWDTFANVLNLAPLIKNGYCELHDLNCPGHEHEAGPSYSYRWQQPDAPLAWGAGRVTVALGDRNPLIDAVRSGRAAPALSMSLNHGGRGQNVLCNDSATIWLDRPIIGRSDNIWLPDGLDQLRMGVRPSQPMDVFLAH